MMGIGMGMSVELSGVLGENKGSNIGSREAGGRLTQDTTAGTQSLSITVSVTHLHVSVSASQFRGPGPVQHSVPLRSFIIPLLNS
jgi:hypothetical protein